MCRAIARAAGAARGPGRRLCGGAQGRPEAHRAAVAQVHRGRARRPGCELGVTPGEGLLFDGERWKSLLAFAANPSACWALSPPVLRTGLEARRRRAGEAQGRQAVHSRALRLRVRRRQGRRVAHVGQHVAYLPRLCADGCVGWGGGLAAACSGAHVAVAASGAAVCGARLGIGSDRAPSPSSCLAAPQACPVSFTTAWTSHS